MAKPKNKPWKFLNIHKFSYFFINISATSKNIKNIYLDGSEKETVSQYFKYSCH